MSNLKNVEPYWKVDDAGLSHVIKEEGKEYEADIVIPADVLKEAFAKFGPKYMKREELDDAADIEKVQPVLNVPEDKTITYFQITAGCTEENLNKLSNQIIDKYGIEVWGFALKQVITDVIAFCNIAYDNQNNIPEKFIHAINTRDANVKKNICKYISYNSGVKFPKDDYFWIIISELLYFIQNI